MKKLFLLAAASLELAGGAAAMPGPVTTVPYPVLTTPSNGSVSTANVFQPILAQNPNRLGCVVTNTSANAESIGVGAAPTAAQAIPLASGAQFPCGLIGGTEITDQLSITSGTAGSTYVVWSQAPAQ